MSVRKADLQSVPVTSASVHEEPDLKLDSLQSSDGLDALSGTRLIDKNDWKLVISIEKCHGDKSFNCWINYQGTKAVTSTAYNEDSLIKLWNTSIINIVLHHA